MNQAEKKSPGRSLRLEVKDFGPVAEAKIDLRPLTVFVGPSNTGKTYMATLIYALHQFFSKAVLPKPYIGGFSRTFSSDFGIHGFGRTGKKFVNKLNEISSTFLNAEPTTENLEFSPELYKIMAKITEENTETLDLLICKCFGKKDIRDMIRKGRNQTNVKIQNWNFGNGEYAEYDFQFGDSERVAIHFPKKSPVIFSSENIEFFRKRRESAGFFRDDIQTLIEILAQPCFSKFIGAFSCTAHYLPAGRTGLMQAQEVMLRSILAEASIVRSHFSEYPRLSGVLGDFLDNLIQVGGKSRESRGDAPGLDVGIEKEVLEGSMKVKTMGPTSHPEFLFRPRGWKNDLSLTGVSSMVSELAPLVLYLRYLLRQEDILIIEEPEAHLHPELQVALMRQLAILVKSGFRVLITTHSEWMVDEIANIVLRSEICQGSEKDTLSRNIALQPEQVGLWYFEQKKRPKRSIVNEATLDNETEMYSPGFEDVAFNIHNDWASIRSKRRNAG